MGISGPATHRAPPFLLPGEHFAAALAFLALGAVGLVWVAPELAAGAYPDRRIVAVTHLFTLGWITLSIMGALYQFLPVALGEPVRSVPLAHVTFGLYVPGLLLFVAGLSLGGPVLLLPGLALLGVAVLLFVGHLGVVLHRSLRRDVTWWSLAVASVFLVLTLASGLALGGNLRWGYLGVDRLTLLGVHVHVALLGWVLLVMVGVANRLLPMFLLSHGVDDRAARLSLGLVAGGGGALVLLHHAPPLLSRWLPALLLGGGVAAFLLQARRFYRHRVRRALDPGLRSAALALVLLATAPFLAVPLVLGTASPGLITAYGAVLVLGISLFVAAHHYKILPFLVWYHRFGPLAGRRVVPRVADLYGQRGAAVAGLFLFSGACGVVLSVAVGFVAGVRGGALLLAMGVAVQVTQMIQVAGRRA